MRRFGLYAVWIVVFILTVASLYAFEYQGRPLSTLDWYERVCLFPLLFLVGQAAWRGFVGMAFYLLPLTLIGLGVSAFQWIVQRGWMETVIASGEAVLVGPLSLWMALGFLAITTVLAILQARFGNLR
jgi:disulfide bond formation protein DsbB